MAKVHCAIAKEIPRHGYRFPNRTVRLARTLHDAGPKSNATFRAGTTQIEKKSLNSLDKFIDKCPECKFDFVPINYYGQSKDFKSHIEFWHKSFPAKPLWITDVNVGQSIADAHQTDPEFLKANKDIVTYLDDADYVQRYAFGYLYEARPNLSFVNKQGKLSALGRFYVAGDKA